MAYSKVPNFTTKISIPNLFKSHLPAKIVEDIVKPIIEVEDHLEAANVKYKKNVDRMRRLKEL